MGFRKRKTSKRMKQRKGRRIIKETEEETTKSGNSNHDCNISSSENPINKYKPVQNQIDFLYEDSIKQNPFHFGKVM